MDDSKKSKQGFLSVPERQSPIAIVLILFRFVQLIFRQLWPVLVVFFFNPSRAGDSWWTIGFAVLGTTSALLSIISYFKFYYYIEGDELIIEKGLFQKKKLNVPFDRIQTINFNQNIVHRFFNVVELEIDTAGSKGKEFSINALSKNKADRIRSYLLSQKKELLETSDNPNFAQEINTIETPDKLLLRLNITDLLKIGLGQNHIRSVGIICGTLFGWMQFAEDAVGKKQFEAYEREYVGIFWESILSIALFVLTIAFFLTLVSTVIRYYDLRFYQTFQGFKIQTGLFTRKENSANMNKIQFVRWTTNPIKSLFKLFNLQLFQAASSVVSSRQSIMIPGCYQNQIDVVRLEYFPTEKTFSFEKHKIHSRIIIRYLLSYGIVPIALYLLLYRPSDYITYAYVLAWFSMVTFLSFWYYKKWSYAISLEGISTKNGLFSTSYTLLKWYKIQSVKLRQTVFQKRRGLTDIYLYTAAGSIKIPYIEADKAISLKNYILFKIESSHQKWM